MKIGFYPRLAWDGVRKNKQMYIPYWLTCQLCVCIFYLIRSLVTNPVIRNTPGGVNMTNILELGSIALAVFSLIFLFYTSTLVIRRRKKEFGLYSVLGMGRRSISRILLWETLITAVISFAAGIGMGIVLSKLCEMIMVRLIGGSASFGFHVASYDIRITLLFFCVIYLLLYLNAVVQVRFASISELLRAEHSGEKPPRANWVLAAAGILMLGAAYWMALSIRHPLTALLLFFAAFILVILGTYLVMVSGSVALCRFLQKRRTYYYQTHHFVSVSSMVYRMKRNGAGLASVCLLSSMVLVMIFSTSGMYLGAEDTISARYPRDLSITCRLTSLEGASKLTDELRTLTQETCASAGVTPEDPLDCTEATVTGRLHGTVAELSEEAIDGNPLLYDEVVTFCLIDRESYNRTSSIPLEMPEGKAMLCCRDRAVADRLTNLSAITFCLTDSDVSEDAVDTSAASPIFSLPIAGTISDFEYTDSGEVQVFPTVYLVTGSLSETVSPFLPLIDSAGDPMMTIEWSYRFNTDAPFETQEQLADALSQVLVSYRNTHSGNSMGRCFVSCRETERGDFYGTFGGFFFLGVLLSAVFLAATVIIIYYKQLSEGFEDQGRFEILQKVGMTTQEIRRSINTQMRTVFFLPLVLAFTHLVFAFPMICRMLKLFSIDNLPLLLLTALVSAGIFSLIYIVVYRATSNVYYRLVTAGDK